MIDAFNNLAIGFHVAFTWTNLLYCFIGCIVGTIIGVLPGIGPGVTIALLLPILYGMDPITGIIMLSCIYYGAQYAGSTTSILLNIPGEGSSVVTCIDGYAMNKNGQAEQAIIAAGISSLIAGCIATVFIAVFSIPLSNLALEFKTVEYCSLLLFSFVCIAILTNGSIINGIGLAIIGILLGIVGADRISGITRFTYDIPSLYDGIGYACIGVGVFGLAELLNNILSNQTHKPNTEKIKFFPPIDQLKKIIPASLRGTAIGTLIGILPGGGSGISSYTAYAMEKKFSKNKENFGKGAIEGVAAPEAANNAAAQAGFIPLLSLGIPENNVMALMLAALVIMGINPGPTIITMQPELFWGLIVSMFIGNIMLSILNINFAKVWIKLISIPRKILYPIIISTCLFGIYSIDNSFVDVIITIVFGLFGYILILCEMNPAPLMIGAVIGPMFEEYFRRELIISNGSLKPFIDSPISVFFLIALSIVLLSSFLIKTNKNMNVET